MPAPKIPGSSVVPSRNITKREPILSFEIMMAWPHFIDGEIVFIPFRLELIQLTFFHDMTPMRSYWKFLLLHRWRLHSQFLVNTRHWLFSRCVCCEKGFGWGEPSIDLPFTDKVPEQMIPKVIYWTRGAKMHNECYHQSFLQSDHFRIAMAREA
jgi:hypothetical protein